MKIVDAQAIPIRIPLKKPFKIALGTLTHTNHVLVRMTDDEGRTGWGETTTFHAVYGYDQKAALPRPDRSSPAGGQGTSTRPTPWGFTNGSRWPSPST